MSKSFTIYVLKFFDEYGKALRQLSKNYFPIGFVLAGRIKNCRSGRRRVAHMNFVAFG